MVPFKNCNVCILAAYYLISKKESLKQEATLWQVLLLMPTPETHYQDDLMVSTIPWAQYFWPMTDCSDNASFTGV